MVCFVFISFRSNEGRGKNGKRDKNKGGQYGCVCLKGIESKGVYM